MSDTKRYYVLLRGEILGKFGTLREAYGYASSTAHPSVRRWCRIYDNHDHRFIQKQEAQRRFTNFGGEIAGTNPGGRRKKETKC